MTLSSVLGVAGGSGGATGGGGGGGRVVVQAAAGAFALPGALIDLRGGSGFNAGGFGVYTGPASLASAIIPEPGTLVLLGMGLAGVAILAQRARAGRQDGDQVE